jgi:hypothetical protein
MAGEKHNRTRNNIGVRLLPATIAALDAAAERTGRSRAAVIEILVAMHAGSLNADTQVPVGVLPVGSRSKSETAPKRRAK